MPALCTECEKPAHGRGLCSTHYAAMRRAVKRGEDVSVPGWARRTKGGKDCSLEGCDEPHHSHGYCSTHSARFVRHGDPTVTVGLRNGECEAWLRHAVTIVTDDCIEWPHSRSHGYGVTFLDGRQMGAHRAALLLTVGEPPEGTEGTEACHSCDNPPCINPRHLRWDTHGANVQDSYDRGRRTGTTGGWRCADGCECGKH